MYDQVVKLINRIETVNEYGDKVFLDSETVHFAELKSIGMNEFYQAQSVGLKPEIKFVLADFAEWNGEKFLKYAPWMGVEEEYTILRTYRSGTSLELVCKKGLE